MSSTTLLRSLLTVGLAATLLGACSDDDSTEPTPAPGPTTPSDPSGGRADTFSAGMAKTGEQGMATFTILEATPAPPARFDNEWRVRITDSGGNPITNATVLVDPTMPDHGHGTNKQATITEEGDGVYRMTPLDLFMPGFWDIRIDVDAGGMTDKVHFGFWIEA